ncbi:serpin A11 [Rhynchonycteris naso]
MASSFYQAVLVVSLCAPIICVSPPSAPSKGSPRPSPTKSTPASQVSSSNTNFAFRLYRRLVLKTPSQNVFFSPVSVSTSLAMLSLGARSATKSQILQSMGFNLTHTPESAIQQGFWHLVHSLGIPRKDLRLRMGSILFIKKELPLQTEFLSNVKRLYESEVFSTDFSNSSTARRRINSYVEKKTQGKVADLIQDLEPQTAMVLVNYIFFKAKWEKPFNPQYTSKRYPFLVGKTTVKVPMMHQEEQFAFGVDPELNCSVLQMDYRGDTAAFFVLPSKGRLRQLEQALSSRTLKKWSHSLQKRWIEVFIPKFSMSTSYDLETILPKMGIRNAFNKNADFSGITKRDFLQVSKAAHKAVLDISEEGTEAAAATATKLTIRSNDGSPHTICFNRSFLLLIVDRATETMLFLGKVENPSKVRMGPAWLWLLGAGILGSAHYQPFPAHGDKSPGVPPASTGQLSEPAPTYHKITPTITNFALRLYKRLAAEASGNIFFSPVSISTTLALLSLGAQADTSTQILEGLGFNLTETPQDDIHQGFQSLMRTLDLPSPKLELKVGNSLFLDKQLKPRQQFLDDIRELYGAFAFSANFTDSATTGRQINDYVRKQTYGQVVDCLQELTDDTLMVLLNYIFFKAKWKHPFNRYQSQKQERTSPRLPMMRQKEMHRFLYDQAMACTVLQIEFSGNAMALLVLPDPGKMGQVEASLQPETLRKWSQLLLPSLLDLHLPRFSISGTYSLEEVLPHIGVTNIFNFEADLSGITGQLNRTISRVSHKAVVDMSERGTRAAAASGLLSQPQSLNMTSAPHAHFNRPFLLFLWEVTTQSLLFLGKVVNPVAG